LLATGAVVVLLLAVVSFKGDVLRGWLHQSDLERIQGRWKDVSFKVNGMTSPINHGDYYVFKGEILRMIMGADREVVKSYYLDEDHQPGWFDMTSSKSRRLIGIYELDGDTLRICTNTQKRPTAFESKPGSENYLWVLQRE